MESFDILVLCVVCFLSGIVVLMYVHRRSCTAFHTENNDEETSEPGTDHDEQDSLLPKFAGLLLSPWHSVTTGQNHEPTRMRTVRNKTRSISLPMSLPLGKRKQTAEVPIKKIHVPYFFPLLDETAEWWQMHQSTVMERPLALEQEAGEDLEDKLLCSDHKME
ncbi:unnamed protein product [Peronospora farinosa]|uniref:Uncharacterized protein n=1 Tax=Peronospora farinosa TaxID=134698 RepID=A0AAV0UCE1_9STRA|nr:unnamed protein product [Peronospora farinosa]CAI5733763.1 unnamed protein product [Peronospora farinosa]